MTSTGGSKKPWRQLVKKTTWGLSFVLLDPKESHETHGQSKQIEGKPMEWFQKNHLVGLLELVDFFSRSRCPDTIFVTLFLNKLQNIRQLETPVKHAAIPAWYLIFAGAQRPFVPPTHHEIYWPCVSCFLVWRVRENNSFPAKSMRRNPTVPKIVKWNL